MSALDAGVVRGNLWILGRGDPTIARGGAWARALPFRPTLVTRLARRIARAGLRHVRGRVIGSTAYFRRDWNAPGWRPDYQSREIPIPTALTFAGNTHRGRHIADPERRLAAALTARLRAVGVRVDGRPGAGRPPARLRRIATVRARPLGALLRYMNHQSSNFFAEVLGKRLAVADRGPPGSIRGAAHALRRWARAHGVSAITHDASGLSYANRISPRGLVRLLRVAGRAPWGRALRRSLPRGGEGTLEDRLVGVPLRAKTGTLESASALSGWLWLRRVHGWANFAILSGGGDKDVAAAIEDRIVRILARWGRPKYPARARRGQLLSAG